MLSLCSDSVLLHSVAFLFIRRWPSCCVQLQPQPAPQPRTDFSPCSRFRRYLPNSYNFIFCFAPTAPPSSSAPRVSRGWAPGAEHLQQWCAYELSWQPIKIQSVIRQTGWVSDSDFWWAPRACGCCWPMNHMLSRKISDYFWNNLHTGLPLKYSYFFLMLLTKCDHLVFSSHRSILPSTHRWLFHTQVLIADREAS